jgi:hypothetical protein
MRILLVALLLWPALAAGSPGNDGNFMAGPLLGLSHSSTQGWQFLWGAEGGAGAGPERINVGVDQRAGKLFGYLELDPWLLVGASLGFGVDEDGDTHPVLGIWEGAPLRDYPCGNGHYIFMASISIGVRYTGAWELYAAPKAGAANPGCID